MKYIIRNDVQFVAYPEEGENVSIDTYDELGLREEGLSGNTHWRWDGMTWVRRRKPISKAQLIQELVGKKIFL